MLRFVLIVAGATAAGAMAGYFGQCTTGSCPLTATWRRGALYGASIGLLMAFSMKG